MPRRLAFVVSSADPLTLVRAVAAELRRAFPEVPLSNADARRAVIAGTALVNGERMTRPGAPVRAGDRIVVLADPARFARARQPLSAADVLQVVYRDAHLAGVDKPAGLPTHATADPSRPHLVALAARALDLAESALGVHQRLDAGTSGLVLFALTDEANRGLARVFAGREAQKIYLCIADGQRRHDLRPGFRWTASGALQRAGEGRAGRQMRVDASGMEAETLFLVRARRENRVWIEARPTTGRQHQIRAHLADARAPIVGDTRYGGPGADRLYLHAWRLRLRHPVTGAPLQLESPMPRGWPAAAASGADRA